MPSALPNLPDAGLVWNESAGYGICDAPPIEYGESYFAHYRELDATTMGAELTAARIAMVRRHYRAGSVIDVGIGGGRFVTESGSCGYDINPEAVQWLRSIGRFENPYNEQAYALTMWDSLEHIPDAEALLSRAGLFAFVSMPVYRDKAHCLASKHFKPGEHFWYFTDSGFVRWAKRIGFDLVERNLAESKIGRDGIVSYALRRIYG